MSESHTIIVRGYESDASEDELQERLDELFSDSAEQAIVKSE